MLVEVRPVLQLVQALRHEATDDSSLLRFLVARAARNPQVRGVFYSSHEGKAERGLRCTASLTALVPLTRQCEMIPFRGISSQLVCLGGHNRTWSGCERSRTSLCPLPGQALR